MSELKREQQEAINHNDGNILISASAGSGKTFVMINRIIRLIKEKKAKVSEIMATTFTEASADEMKERLRQALFEEISNGREDLADELADIYSADISTLHAFNAKLIRTYFFTADLPFDFKICDEDEANRIRKESIDSVFKKIYANNDKETLKFLDRFRFNRKDERLKSIILSCVNFAESEIDPKGFLSKTLRVYNSDGFDKIKERYFNYLKAELLRISEKLKENSEIFTANGTKTGIYICNELLSIIDDILNNGLYRVKAYEGKSITGRFPSKMSDSERQAKEETFALRDGFNKLINRFASNLKSESEDRESFNKLQKDSEQFIKIAFMYIDEYQKRKLLEDYLDFSDLEHYAIKILDDEDIRKAVKEKYKYIFIDEYQDINSVQEEIISRISSDNLFMVGDVKQSIYGFRGCRPEIFANKFDKMQQNGEKTLLLNHNFRSSPKVINLVNEVFSYSMTNEFYGQDYKSTAKLISGGGYKEEHNGRVELHLFKNAKETKEKEVPRIYDILKEDVKEKFKDGVSELIANIIYGELDKKYYDIKTKEEKYVRLNDIVILTRNKNNTYIENLVKGLLKRGIPVTSELTQNICDYPEVQTLINALKLINCFKEDLPLISTLKSPIGKLTDEDLAEIALKYSDDNPQSYGGFYDAYNYYLENVSSVLSEKLKDFTDYFKNLRFLADYLGANGVLEKLLEDFGYENYLNALNFGDLKVKRVRRFVSLSKKDGVSLTVLEFLKMIEQQNDAFTMSVSSSEDTVRLMTIHASKGLEFPVCIVCGLERHLNSQDESSEVIMDREFGFALKDYNDEDRTYSETILRGLIKEKLKENRLKEELRLFYVALTRAKYSLHLTFEQKEDNRKEVFSGANSFLDYVPKHIDATEFNKGEAGLINETRERRKILIGKIDQPLYFKMQQNFAYEYPYLKETLMPLKTSITASLFSGENEDNKRAIKIEDDSEDKANTTLGTTAHKILELLDFTRLDDFDVQVKEMINNNEIKEDDLKDLNLERLKRAVLCEEFKEFKDKAIYKEKGFIMYMPANLITDTSLLTPILVQGVIDLLVLDNSGATIIDYKYSKKDINSLRSHYKKQLDLYAYAVKEILNVNIVKKVLVNIFSGEKTVID